MLEQAGPRLSPAKCTNFLIRILSQQISLPKRRAGPSRWRQNKERLRATALKARQDGEEGQVEQEKSSPKLLFDANEDFRLLGLQLDEHWSSRSHIEEVKKKTGVRLTILRRLSGLNRGPETRILAITEHALMESVIGYGLTNTGSALSRKDFRQWDTRVLNPVARHITGVSPATRREVTSTLADIKSA